MASEGVRASMVGSSWNARESLRERQGWSLIASLWVHGLLLLSLPYCSATHGGAALSGTTGRSPVSSLALVSVHSPVDADGAVSTAVAASAAASSALSKQQSSNRAHPSPAASGPSSATATPSDLATTSSQAAASSVAASGPDTTHAADATSASEPAPPEPTLDDPAAPTPPPEAQPLAPDQSEAQQADASTPPPSPTPTPEAPSPAAQRPDEVEAEEVVDEPIADLEEEADHERWLDFVRNTDERDAAPTSSAAHVSNRSSSAEVETRSLARDADSAKPTNDDTSRNRTPAAPSLHTMSGAKSDPSGSRPDQRSDRQAGLLAGGGGQRSAQASASTRGVGGTARDGGRAAPAGVATTPTLAASASESQGESQPTPLAPPPSPAPSWWHPTAFLLPPTPAAKAQAAAPAPTRTSPTRSHKRSSKPTAQPLDQAGGTGGEVEEIAAVGEPPKEQPGEDTPQIDEGLPDPVQSLRDALGWGGIDRSALAPRAATAGTADGDGSPQAASDVILDDRFLLDDNIFINAEGTALGEYIARMDEAIQESWDQIQLTAYSKAIGITGSVTVYFRVQANGKVTDVRLISSSGNAALDQRGVQAIPRRVERRPHEVELEGDLHRKITFVYRDGLAAGSRR